jgi:hypothetical protein
MHLLTYVCVCVCLYVRMYVCMHVCMQTRPPDPYECLFVDTPIALSVNICNFCSRCVYLCVCVYIYMHMYVYEHTLVVYKSTHEQSLLKSKYVYVSTPSVRLSLTTAPKKGGRFIPYVHTSTTLITPVPLSQFTAPKNREDASSPCPPSQTCHLRLLASRTI